MRALWELFLMLNLLYGGFLVHSTFIDLATGLNANEYLGTT